MHGASSAGHSLDCDAPSATPLPATIAAAKFVDQNVQRVFFTLAARRIA
jgi:hypothetical protein